jgi:hypothetical protein
VVQLRNLKATGKEGEEFMISEFEDAKYIDNEEEADWLYGGSEYILTDEDIEALKHGKMINFTVNMEYGCILKYVKEKNL